MVTRAGKSNSRREQRQHRSDGDQNSQVTHFFDLSFSKARMRLAAL
jgi:hypothetical protein